MRRRGGKALTLRGAGLSIGDADSVGGTTETVTLTVGEGMRDPVARYLTGLQTEQSGDKEGAVADWTQLVAEGDPNDGLIASRRPP
jgi:hypothetical protein